MPHGTANGHGGSGRRLDTGATNARALKLAASVFFRRRVPGTLLRLSNRSRVHPTASSKRHNPTPPCPAAPLTPALRRAFRRPWLQVVACSTRRSWLRLSIIMPVVALCGSAVWMPTSPPWPPTTSHPQLSSTQLLVMAFGALCAQRHAGSNPRHSTSACHRASVSLSPVCACEAGAACR